MIRIQDMIRHDVLQRVLSPTRPGRPSHDRSVLEKFRSRAKTQEPGQGHIGIELQHHALLQTHAPYEKLESYASMKRRLKENKKVIQTLGTLLFCMMVLSFGLLLYTLHLKDSILLHQYQEHKVTL